MDARYSVISYKQRQQVKVDLAAFSCGNDDLDRYLREVAWQDVKRHAATVYLVLDDERDGTIAGYYTLSAYSVGLSELTGAEAKKIPRYPQVPAYLIGRLARDRRYKGLGGQILSDALDKALQASGDVAAYAVVVEAKDTHASEFYKRYGFLDLSPRRLYLPMSTIAAAVSATLSVGEAAAGRTDAIS